MSLKIGIDACPLSGRVAGIGRYVLEICKVLEQCLPDAQFFLYSQAPLEVALPSARWVVRDRGNWWMAHTPTSYIWLKAWVKRMAEADGVDIFWATRTILPARSKSFKTVCTVHDLNYLLFPHSMPHVTFWAHKMWFARDVYRADAVVANSQGTANRLKQMLCLDADTVALPGVTAAFGPQKPEVVAACLAALNVSHPYFLSVGTFEPRKNLPTLIAAFLELKRSGRLVNHELLLVGSQGWRRRKINSLLRRAAEEGVRWLGFVSDAELAVLYAGAAAFVFPSIYEGFGIPALEARACGAKVVASDLPELHEAAGPEAIYVAPTVEGFCSGLLAVLHTPAPSAGIPTDWSGVAQTMAATFQSLSSGSRGA